MAIHISAVTVPCTMIAMSGKHSVCLRRQL